MKSFIVKRFKQNLYNGLINNYLFKYLKINYENLPINFLFPYLINNNSLNFGSGHNSSSTKSSSLST